MQLIEWPISVRDGHSDPFCQSPSSSGPPLTVELRQFLQQQEWKEDQTHDNETEKQGSSYTILWEVSTPCKIFYTSWFAIEKAVKTGFWLKQSLCLTCSLQIGLFFLSIKIKN